MKSDIVFKAFFSKAGNERFLNDFLNAILGENVKIKTIKHDARLEQLVLEEKYGVLDLEVELESGEVVDIEMQLKDYKNMEKRTTFYAAKKISEQKGIGKYYEGLKKVIIIAILNYSLTPLPEYITETVRAAKRHRDYEINNFVQYYYIELEKFRNQTPNMKEKLNQWIAFIDGERDDWIDMAKKESKIIKDADREYNVLTGDEELKRLAEIRMLSEMEEHSALMASKEEGREEGRKEGRIEMKIDMAKKMIEEQMDIEMIKKVTGLSSEEILKLKDDKKSI